MAITAKGKIKEMIRMGKADQSVSDEYTRIESEYKESKQDYKLYKKEYEEKKQKLSEYNQKLKETPFFKRRDIKKKIRLLNKKIEKTEQKYKKAREKYKQNLKELRALKRIIRTQSRVCKAYQKFFAKLDEAKNMGIHIPRYIQLEAIKQKSLYQKSIFSIDNKDYTYIPEPNIQCIRELVSIIREAKAKERKEKVQKLIENVKESFSKPEGQEPGDM